MSRYFECGPCAKHTVRTKIDTEVFDELPAGYESNMCWTRSFSPYGILWSCLFLNMNPAQGFEHGWDTCLLSFLICGNRGPSHCLTLARFAANHPAFAADLRHHTGPLCPAWRSGKAPNAAGANRGQHRELHGAGFVRVDVPFAAGVGDMWCKFGVLEGRCFRNTNGSVEP